jgi:hypothetical protein
VKKWNYNQNNKLEMSYFEHFFKKKTSSQIWNLFLKEAQQWEKTFEQWKCQVEFNFLNACTFVGHLNGRPTISLAIRNVIRQNVK